MIWYLVSIHSNVNWGDSQEYIKVLHVPDDDLIILIMEFYDYLQHTLCPLSALYQAVSFLFCTSFVVPIISSLQPDRLLQGSVTKEISVYIKSYPV